jgi:hypothetical protein
MAAIMIEAGRSLMSPCRHSPIAILLVFAALRVCAAQPASSEPNMSCPGDYSPSFDNCVATLQYKNGFIYGGELHHGMREGFGFLIVPHVSDRDILSNKLGDLTREDGVDQNSTQTIPQITVIGKRQLREFKVGLRNGRGMVLISGGGYYGVFKDHLYVGGTPTDTSEHNQ